MLTQKISFTAAELPPPRRGEILRYMQTKEISPEVEAMLGKALGEAEHSMQFSVCWREVPFLLTRDGLLLAGKPLASHDFASYLADADKLLLFAATTGIAFERVLQKAAKISPARTLCLHAVGSERAEALCDTFCDFIAKKAKKDGLMPKPRFSAGYGDLPLTLQEQIFALLDCQRQIGISLGEHCLMTPVKSVTAFVALKKVR